MSKEAGKNDKAWNKLFEKYKILEEIDKNGIFEITAPQISEFREPRLMTKFDHTINLPEIFSDNQLSILPITRGSYVIAPFSAYHTFEQDNSPITKVSLPTHIQSLNSSNITSEAIALNCAVASGIIADFTEDEKLIPTVSGRMGSGNFQFDIKNIKNNSYQNIKIESSQIEIDAAYEGTQYLSLFEAKRDLSEDFIIRQLYYPYRVWKDKLTKEIKTIFLVYSNGIYHLYEYQFQNPNQYNSLILVKQKNYSIEDTAINTQDIQSILKSVKIVNEPDIAFPQANTFTRVINLCELLNEKELKKDEITENYAFDSRQTDYYTNAARYLGLLEKTSQNKNITYQLSNLGRKILHLNYKQRQLEYCRLILSHQIFNDIFNQYFSTGKIPEKKQIVSCMKAANLHEIHSDQTFHRRASTIISWIEWIIGLINE